MRTEPSNLLRAAGRRSRVRRVPEICAGELALRQAMTDLLRGAARADWRWRFADARTSHRSQPHGWPDIVLVSPGGVFHGLTLVAEDGRRTNDQEDFRMWAIRHGIRHGVAGSLDEMLIVLDAWGAIAPISDCQREPK